MYFESRIYAGGVLASKLYERFYGEPCVVVGLSDGGVQVGEQIAGALQCKLAMLVIEQIPVPGESISFGAVDQSGSFTVNSGFSEGEIDEYNGEFHSYFDEQKRETFQKINRLIGVNGTIDKDMLRDHVVILVSDGLNDPTPLDSAMGFLKAIHTRRVVVATPIASVPAVDRMHILADELLVLSVKDNYISTDHYYEYNDVPSHEETIAKISQNIGN